VYGLSMTIGFGPERRELKSPLRKAGVGTLGLIDIGDASRRNSPEAKKNHLF
jgi:hypothetical protein